MCCSHALSGDTWKRGDLDFTGGMMILVLRALSLCTNRTDGFNASASHSSRAADNGGADQHAADGVQPAKSGTSGGSGNSEQHVPADPPPGTLLAQEEGRAPAQLSAYLQERRLEHAPGLFDVAAFFFANGSLLGGPFFEYKEWQDFLRRDGAFYEVSVLLGMIPCMPGCMSDLDSGDMSSCLLHGDGDEVAV